MRSLLRKTFLIQSIIGSFILLLTIFAGIADAKITDINAEVLQKQNLANNYLILALGAQEAHNTYSMYVPLGIQINPQTFERAPQIDSNPKLKNDADKFYTGTISSSQYLTEYVSYLSDEYARNSETYKAAVSELNLISKNGSPWSLWKNIFLFLQITLILGSILIGIRSSVTK
ncbi:MAG: hypothetical protein JWN18_234 [Parcubacteria group bacterium]|nr:hypothetical protein [Parcubacteria group bacterium]